MPRKVAETIGMLGKSGMTRHELANAIHVSPWHLEATIIIYKALIHCDSLLMGADLTRIDFNTSLSKSHQLRRTVH